MKFSVAYFNIVYLYVRKSAEINFYKSQQQGMKC